MVIGEVAALSAVKNLLTSLVSFTLKDVALTLNVEPELQKLEDALTLIEALLSDAGEKQLREKSVQVWLNQLHHLTYELEDLIDRLAIEAKQRRLADAGTSSRVLKFIPSRLHATKYALKMGSKLKKVTRKLDDLIKRRQLLGLVERPYRATRRLEEISQLDEKVIGREHDKEALLRVLLGGESSSSQTRTFKVVSIVGMGGIGKTALAQLLYNDEQVKGHFKLMAWVPVSEDFDVFRITKAIFQAVGGGDKQFDTLDLLHSALEEIVANKKFLFVLDDVWNEDNTKWRTLKRLFSVGSHGSRVLVTTRNTNVALTMDSVQAYRLGLLSNEDALSLFVEHASCEHNLEWKQTLHLHANDIIEKCAGLPLALRTLGSVFRLKSNHEEWEELLNSHIWKVDDNGGVIPALMLSYYDLPAVLKRVFAYCSLFPKGYLFDKDRLVLLWMAEGYLNNIDEHKPMELLGGEYFSELVSRSFFQHLANNISQYMMHDLVHDLATSVAGEFFLKVDDKMDTYKRNGAFEKVHHVSVVQERHERCDKFKELLNTRHLRTFFPVVASLSHPHAELNVENKVLLKILPQLKFLRVLSLAGYNIKEVPEFIGSLMHVRYLNFSHTQISSLPEQVCELQNLQSLLLYHCYSLSSLPDDISKLINLRHLGLTPTPRLKKMPLGITELRGLHTLTKVVIGETDEFNISHLKGLTSIQDEVCIKNLQKVKNASLAKDGNLQENKGVRDLLLQWSDAFDDSRNEASEYEVLEELRPFWKLKSIDIEYYGGKKFPSWFGDPSFVCLTSVTLTGCERCTLFPTLGYLPVLKYLKVEDMHGLESLGSESSGPSTSNNGVLFPSLISLSFVGMLGWKEWSGIGDGEAFPCLYHIALIKCPKLETVTIKPIPSLRKMQIAKCPLVVLQSMAGVASSIDSLQMSDIEGHSQELGEILWHLRAIENLDIQNCGELTHFGESEDMLERLRVLRICMCDALVLSGKERMESVREVTIASCGMLESYHCPSNIEKLDIIMCLSSLTFPTTDGLSSTLMKLRISSCNDLDPVCLKDNFLVSLESLDIYKSMRSLKLLDSGYLNHLTSLSIHRCKNIRSIPENGYGFLPFCCLKNLCIRRCKNLESFPHTVLPRMESLETMWIESCPKLDYSVNWVGWPPNLRRLTIGRLKNPISEWKLQNLPSSLAHLSLDGTNSGIVSFPKTGFLLPPSLNRLNIIQFIKLKSVREGLQDVTCLKHLFIVSCPELKDVPETILSSLSTLHLSKTPKLEKKCHGKKSIFSKIPELIL